MRSVLDETTLQDRLTGQKQQMIREQMNRLLETNHFKNSRRYPTLFRFIVEETLEGRGAFLKERLLGIRVFDRPADYDTATDPIVRVTIAEIRKRIAQYYHDEAHDAELRIELLPGHYAPEFRFRKEADATRPAHASNGESQPKAAKPAELSLASEDEAKPQLESKPGFRAPKLGVWAWAALGPAALAILVLATLLVWRTMHPSAVDQFWAPVLATHKPVLLCVPTGAGRIGGMAAITSEDLNSRPGTPASAGGPTFLDHEALGENVVFSDVLAMIKVSDLLATHDRDYRPRLNISTSLEDLREGPAVLIGGMDNQWTLQAVAPLRFRFAGTDEGGYWISDSTDPMQKEWSLNLHTKLADVRRDYAIIARLRNEQTGQIEIVIAGIGMTGTAAAGEFVVDPQQMTALQHRVGKDFADRDMEIVLGTDVINGIAGSPKVLATWVR